MPYATVELDNRFVQADASGRYEFDDMEPGTYSLASFSGCDGLREPNMTVDGDTHHDVEISQYFDSVGYSCDLEDADWIPADDPIPTDTWEMRDFGFAFPYNGRVYTEGVVGLDGLALYGSEPDDDAGRVSIEIWPGRSPQGDDAGGVYTATVGSAPNRMFVIEMRNVMSYEYPGERETFEMIFAEDGTVTTIFHDLPRILPENPIMVLRMPWDGEWSTYFDDDRGFSTGKAMVMHPPAAS
jgi:hypothetical protein